MKSRILLLGLLLTSICWATPSAKERANLKALLPAGHNLVETIVLKLQTQADTVTISEKDGKFYLFVVPQGAKKALSVTTLDKQGLTTPIQGPHQEKLSKLVSSQDLDHNGKPYLFVYTYLADVTGVHVFKATPKGYQEVFQESTIADFRFDPQTAKLTRTSSDAEPAKAWQWNKGRFVVQK